MGWAFLGISMLVLPNFLAIGNSLLASPLSATEVNLLYFCINFLGAVLIFWKFLWESVKKAVRTPQRCLLVAAIGYGLYRLAGLLLAFVIVYIRPDFANVNDETIAQLAGEHYPLMVIATVLLVPIYEELFYRGLFFQGLHKKSRVLAYGASIVVFACIHVMGYIGMYDPVILLLCFAQYLPAGAALAWAYEKSDTIVTPILMHIVINSIGFLFMR